MDVYYIAVFASPIMVFIFFMIVLKICWKCCTSRRDEMDDEEHSNNTPIYIIPISLNEVEENSSDEDSVVSVDPYSPPSYDTLDPPPPYSEKPNVPEEAPPTYSQLEVPASSAELYESPLSTENSSYNEP